MMKLCRRMIAKFHSFGLIKPAFDLVYTVCQLLNYYPRKYVHTLVSFTLILFEKASERLRSAA